MSKIIRPSCYVMVKFLHQVKVTANTCVNSFTTVVCMDEYMPRNTSSFWLKKAKSERHHSWNIHTHVSPLCRLTMYALCAFQCLAKDSVTHIITLTHIHTHHRARWNAQNYINRMTSAKEKLRAFFRTHIACNFSRAHDNEVVRALASARTHVCVCVCNPTINGKYYKLILRRRWFMSAAVIMLYIECATPRLARVNLVVCTHVMCR